MNFLYKDFQNYLDEFNAKLEKETPHTVVGLAIPYIYLKEASEKIGAKIKVMAQDLHHIECGAFTSCVSAAQISSLQIPASIVGHSECRAMSQNPLVITNKVKSALACGLEVIYCCGADPVNEVTEELKTLKPEQFERLIIAYEPISSIGTGSAMNANTAAEIIKKIRAALEKQWGSQVASSVKILYGGSVNLKNYKEYLDKKEIDGVLVGGASLKVEDFWNMAMLR